MSDIEQILPLVITDEQGSLKDVTFINEKGYKKSIETGTLWFIHPKRGRLLPYKNDTSFVSLTSGDRWYHAVIRGGKPDQRQREAYGDVVPPAQQRGEAKGD
jgi:hypothetical protein